MSDSQYLCHASTDPRLSSSIIARTRKQDHCRQMLQFSTPEELEKRFVHEAYKEIAPGFKNARYKAWPCVVDFLRSQPSGSIIADVGCGTGKYLSITTDSYITGSDTCSKFIEIARERHHEVAVCDNLRLPYRDGCFDAVISVGVIHHLASSKRRLRAIQELARTLRPGGKLMVCVWAMEQNHRKFNGQDVLVPYRHHKMKVRRRAKPPGLRNNMQSPKQTSKLVHDQSNLRRSKSCSMLYDGQQLPQKVGAQDKVLTDELSLTFSTDLRVLRELVATLKNRKEQLITNINAQVVKLHSEKDTGKINFLLSKIVGKLFDRKNGLNEDKTRQDEEKTQKGSETGIPNIPNLLSDLVKRLFKDREVGKGRTRSECGGTSPGNTGVDDTAWETKGGPASSAKCPLSRGGSFDSECSESDIELMKQSEDCQSEDCRQDASTPSSVASTVDLQSLGECRQDASTPASVASTVGQDSIDSTSAPDTTSNKITLQFLARLMETLSSSSDTDSDGSITPDLFNSDSGISDSEQQQQGNTTHSPSQKKRTITNCTSVCCSHLQLSSSGPATACGEDNAVPKSKELQRFYHVFREGELTELITGSVPSVEVIKEYYHHGNWAVVVEKL